MKKAAFPLYILLVAGFFACLQTDELLGNNELAPAAAVVFVQQACPEQQQATANTILVNAGCAKMYSGYQLKNASRLLLLQGNHCCDAALNLGKQYE